jgi:AAHS family benzoate transporter-like MFS transporter
MTSPSPGAVPPAGWPAVDEPITVARTPVAIWFLSLATLVFEGYDVYVYGAAVPYLLQHPGWALGPRLAGVIGSAAVFGMLVGSLVAGLATKRLGRRRVYLATILCFSIGSALSALAPTPELLLAARLMVGLGAGGFIPTALAMVVEYSPATRKNLTTAFAAVGMGLGAGIGGIAAIWIGPVWGYQGLFWLGAAPLLLIAPVAFARAPESVSLLLTQGRTEEAQVQIRRYRLPVRLSETAAAGSRRQGPVPTGRAGNLFTSARALFAAEHVRPTILFWLATAMSLLLVFGSYTWLPVIMIRAGYGLTSALAFFVCLQVGAVGGTLVGSLVGDRRGPKNMVLSSFACAVIGLVLLAAKPPTLAVYPLVILVGIGAGGTQCLLYAYLASYYPPTLRDSGLGLASAFGRLGGIAGPLIGGTLAAGGATPAQNFLVFAIAPLIALALLAFGPRIREVRERRPD